MTPEQVEFVLDCAACWGFGEPERMEKFREWERLVDGRWVRIKP